MHTLAQLNAGELQGIKQLKIKENLVSFPKAIYTLKDTLELLDLSGNKLTELPDDFACLHQLKILFLSENQFTTFPSVLQHCSQLEMIGFKSNQIQHIPEQAIPVQTRWLILTNNQITQLPNSIGDCYRLEKCMLAGNRLKSLPDRMAKCTALALLRIAANELTSLPAWLFTLPHLAWLACSGNPLEWNRSLDDLTDLPTTSFSEIELLGLLGEGASGHIYQAKSKQHQEQVAVKLFKGAVTSDGLPDDEMNACVLAGNHPHLVPLLGAIVNHPQHRKGLLLSLIPPSYSNLGATPSYNSCTRDVYLPTTIFKPNEITAIAKAIASVGAHLHSKGIMHGDLYAHNILYDRHQVHAILGDFGAATCYPLNSKPLANSLEAIDVKAFGFLLDDLLQHSAGNHQAMELIEACRDACLHIKPTERPSFNALVTTLARLD